MFLTAVQTAFDKANNVFRGFGLKQESFIAVTQLEVCSAQKGTPLLLDIDKRSLFYDSISRGYCARYLSQKAVSCRRLIGILSLISAYPIHAAAPLSINTATIPDGMTGVPYTAVVTASGSTQPYSWKVSAGSLPNGLSVGSSSGAISGTPTVAGSYGVTVQVSDALGNTASHTFTLPVLTPCYYVSGQNGNDSWSGLLPEPNAAKTDGPFQTLTRAQSAMRSSSTIKAAMVFSGTYSISSGLPFDWADTSESWSAYPGQIPVLDGGGHGTINLTGVSNLSFQGFTFQNMGAGGLVFLGAPNTTIRSNTFYNCNANCLSGSLSNSIIDSNTINGQSTGDSAIKFWYGSSNNKVTHNLIENCQGGGINFATGATDPPANNNIVDRNVFLNVNISSSDQGAIYMADRSHSVVGNQITNNLIHGNGGGSLTSSIKAIYLDDLMSNTLVSGNVCNQCGQYALQIHGGDHNTITNNIFDLSSGANLVFYQVSTVADDGMAQNLIDKNIIYSSTSGVPPLYVMMTSSSDASPSGANNMYYFGSSSTNTSAVPAFPLFDAAPVFANPAFAQPSAMNYTMPSSSPAYTEIGFQPLPVDQGPVNSTKVSTAPMSFLTGSGNSATTTVNLTTEGTTDWAHWGTTSLTRKGGVTAEIGAWSIVGSGPANYYTNDPRAITFSDGTLPSFATVHDGIYVNGSDGFSFTAPAGTSEHTLTVHVGGYYSGGTFTAHLSDDSAADFVDTTGNTSGQFDRNYTLNYQAASAGQTITITWIRSSGTGNVTLNGAALK